RRRGGERSARDSRGDPRLDHAVRRPRLVASWLEAEADLERNRRRPERMHARRVRGQDDAEPARLSAIGDEAPALILVAAVEDVEVEPARQSAQHLLDARENAVEDRKSVV